MALLDSARVHAWFPKSVHLTDSTDLTQLVKELILKFDPTLCFSGPIVYTVRYTW